VKLSRHFFPQAQVGYGKLREIAPDIQVVLPDAQGAPRRAPLETDEIPEPEVIAFFTAEEAFLFHLDADGKDRLIQLLTGGIVVAGAHQLPPDNGKGKP
jgi:Tfp pilus assembly protein FimV